MFPILDYKSLRHWQTNPHSARLDESGWYVILLGNYRNPTPAQDRVYANFAYLNKRTRQVPFCIPGFKQSPDGDIVFEECDVKYKFDFQGFIDTVLWIESMTRGYSYSESLELLLLPYQDIDREVTFDFSHMLRYNLDELLSENKNIFDFIMKAVEVVEQNLSYEETQMLMNVTTKELPRQAVHKVFIAGSKSLENQRDAIVASFNRLSNRGPVRFEVRSFEDFDRSFIFGGRQQEYNSFIENEADSVVFILSDTIGGITRDEFDIAMNKFKETNRPEIYVYNHNPGGTDQVDRDIAEIRDIINENCQYWTDYIDLRHLKLLILEDFSRY